MLSWKPSAAFRALCAIRGILGFGIWYLVLFLFFPHVLLVALAAIAALAIAAVFIPVRVTLDPGLDEVRIKQAWRTWRMPLTDITSVEEVLRFGTEISLRNGVSWSIGPFKKSRRRLARWLRVRTGFEGIELTVIQAVAAARTAAGLDMPATPDDKPPSYLAGSVVFTGGLAAMAAVILVRPQVAIPGIHVAATLIAIWYGFWAAVFLLLGGGILFSRVRRGRGNLSNGHPGPGRGQ